MFSKEEKSHYERHFLLDLIGIEGQKKLKKSNVLIIGAGGLGCPILQYLSAAGVGTIGIIDNDIIDKSNLQRQVLFTVNDIGKPKATIAAERLAALNPHITFETYIEYLSSENALNLFKKYDIIVDGSDNFQTRYLANDAAVLTNKPLVSGAIFKFEGQVTVLNYKNGPTYRCLYPTPPDADSIPNCSEIGVLGVLPGIIGSLQANEVIKIICEIGEILKGRLLTFNALNLQQHIFKFNKNESITITQLIDYDQFCGIKRKNNLEITSSELTKLLKHNDVTLVDVRKLLEREQFNIGGTHIPLHEIHKKTHYFKNLHNIVLYCKVGQRSLAAAKIILEKFPNKNIKSLQGGLASWKKSHHHEFKKN